MALFIFKSSVYLKFIFEYGIILLTFLNVHLSPKHLLTDPSTIDWSVQDYSFPTDCCFTFVLESSKAVQFSCTVMSDSLWPHGLQHARPPCLSPTPGIYPNSCPLSQWCHPTISSSVIPFSSCLQFFPALGSFPISRLFISGGQSVGTSALASVLPMNIQGWFPLGLISKEIKTVLVEENV